MANKFFGQYLLEKGLISKDQLLNTLAEQRRQNPRLGDLAIEQDYITEDQAKKINQRQLSTDARFGDLAIEMGFISTEQLDHLIGLQGQKRKFFGELLVELNYMTEAVVTQELESHKSTQGVLSDLVQVVIDSHPESDCINACADIVSKLFTRILSVPAQFSELLSTQELDGFAETPFYTSSISIESVKSTVLSIAAEKNLMEEIASRLIKMDKSEVDLELAIDATGEFLNIVAGYYAKEVIPDDCSYKASPPKHADNFVSITKESADLCGLKFESEMGVFFICIGQKQEEFFNSHQCG